MIGEKFQRLPAGANIGRYGTPESYVGCGREKAGPPMPVPLQPPLDHHRIRVFAFPTSHGGVPPPFKPCRLGIATIEPD